MLTGEVISTDFGARAMIRLLALIGVTMGCLAAGAAFAADAPQTNYDWSGAYVGASVGYGSGSTGNSWWDAGISNWEPDGKIKFRSLLGGGYIGIQQQFGKVVVGAEADYTWMKFHGDDSQFAGQVNGLEINGVGSARARLGLALGRSLLYVTGGLAYGEITKSDKTLLFTQTSAKAIGWTAGVGAEHAFTDNWIGRIGYQYTDLGNVETLLQNPAIGSYTHRTEGLTFHAVQVGLSYKF